MKKKLMALLMTVLMVVGLVGCGGGNNGELIKVGIINLDSSESGYRTANNNDLKNRFTEANGYDASFFYSMSNDEQVAQAQKFIQDGVDYLLLSAADTSGWDAVLKDAQAAGVSVILFDRVIDASDDLYAASVVSDMVKEGQTAVEWLKSQNLSEYNIIHIQGTIGSSAQIGRTKAVNEAVEKDGWKLVTQQGGEWSEEKAQQIVQSVIDSGESFNVIYAENDGMARGAVAALDKAGITHGIDGDVIIMGFDCNKFALKAVWDGEWNYDGQCNPFQSEIIDGIIKKLEKGEKLAEKVIYLEEKGFNKTNMTEDDIEKYGI